MNSKTTWLLVGVALALSLYMAFFDSRSASRAKAAAKREIFPLLDPQNVTAITVRWTNAVIRAQKAGEQWQLISPAYPGQQTSIRELVEAIASLKEDGFVPARDVESQPGGFALYGFDGSAPTVVVSQGTNRFQFAIGRNTLVKDQIYLQVQNASGISITSAKVLRALPNSVDDWRDRQLVSALPLLDRIEVQSGTRTLEIQQDPATRLWRLKKPMSARADAARVQVLLQKIATARVEKFVSDDPKSDLEAFGLSSPEAELRLSRGTNALLQIQFGKSPTNDLAHVYARNFSHTNVVLISKELLDLVEKEHAFFRDRALLTFPLREVDRIEMRGSENFAIQRQTNGGWQVVEPAAFDADPEWMRGFLRQLGQLQIVEFHRDVVADFSPFGLMPPARQIVLAKSMPTAAGPTNQILAQVDFSTNNIDHQPDKVFARRADENSVYAISFGELMRLSWDPFLLRDRHVWTFSPNTISSIRIHQKGKTRALERTPAGSWPLDPVHNAALEETLLRLGQLKAVAWVARSNHKFQLLNFPGIDYHISLQQNTSAGPATLLLQFGPLSREGPYAAVQLPGDKEHSVFIFPPSLYQLIADNLSVP